MREKGRKWKGNKDKRDDKKGREWRKEWVERITSCWRRKNERKRKNRVKSFAVCERA